MDAQAVSAEQAEGRLRLPEGQGSAAGHGLAIIKMTSPREAVLLLPLARSWHAESQYSHLPFSERKFLTQVIKSLQRQNDGATFYVVRGGEAVGLIDVAAGEAWLCEGGRYATCLAWFVRPDVRGTLMGGRVAWRLLDQAKAWAVATGAATLFLNGTHGPRRSFARMGAVMGENVAIDLNRTVARAPQQ